MFNLKWIQYLVFTEQFILKTVEISEIGILEQHIYIFGHAACLPEKLDSPHKEARQRFN